MHCPTCDVNFCVLCYRLFRSAVGIVKMKGSISTRYKRLKGQKNQQILCGIHFYISLTQLFGHYGE